MKEEIFFLIGIYFCVLLLNQYSTKCGLNLYGPTLQKVPMKCISVKIHFPANIIYKQIILSCDLLEKKNVLFFYIFLLLYTS